MGHPVVYVIRISSDMQDAAHIMMNLDIATGVWLIDFCLKAAKPYGLKSRLKNFVVDIKQIQWDPAFKKPLFKKMSPNQFLLQ